MRSIKVSFILPCYNTGKYLRQCVDSILGQGFPEDEYEIICVNNAATDDTGQILSELSSRYSSIKVVTLLVNQCSGGAYNAGLDVAKGKYVQFVDSDDYLKKESVLPLYDLMERESLEMLYFNIEPFKEDDELTYVDNLRFNGNIRKAIETTTGDGFLTSFFSFHDVCMIPVPAYRKMILREKLIETGVRFSHTTIGTDFAHNIELLSKLNRIAAVCNKPYMFRHNPNGVTKSKMTSAKIVYALNNYGKAYSVVCRADWMESNKQKLIAELSSTINTYLRYIKDLNSDETCWIHQNIKYFSVLKSVAKGTLNKLFLVRPDLYAKFQKFPLVVNIAYKLLY